MNYKLSDDVINCLYSAFAKNKFFSDWFEDDSKVPSYIWLSYYDLLTNIEELPIVGLQGKLADIGSTEKLTSTLSEIKASRLLAERGFEVELLSDNDKKFPKHHKKDQEPPDLYANRGDFKLLVEVTRKSEDDPLFLLHKELTPILTERDFILSVFYSEELSQLAVDYRERNENKKLFQEFTQELQRCLNFLSRDQLPYDFSLDSSIISVKPAEPGWGRISYVTSSMALVPKKKYIQQVQDAIRRKAKKRKSWSSDHLKEPFLIFLDLEASVNLYKAVFPALYGSRMLIDWLKANQFGPQRVTYPEFVMDKLQGSQQELLFKLGFDSRRRSYIDKPGFFVTEEVVRSNVSGVVTMRENQVECFPNPFCNKQIWLSNLPELIGVPLTSSAVGGAG
jgi:hypothetical protein